MICNKCKKEVPSHKSICPHCNSLLVSDNGNHKKNNTNFSNAENLIIKNKFVDSNAAFLVGGTVSDDKGSKVSIKRTKSCNDVKKNQTLNSINKPSTKQDVKKQRKEYEKLLKQTEKEMNAKIFSIEKVKRAPKVTLAFLKSEGHAQVKNVGSKTTKKYDNPIMKGGISKSGKLIKVEFVGRKTSNRDFTMGDILYYMTVITIWILVVGLILNVSGIDYYFDESANDLNSNSSSSNVDYTEYKGTSKSGQDSAAAGDGVTSIVYDNQYLKLFVLRSENDVLKVIESDSRKLKENCPSNIVIIEYQIINQYGITAVNLCEMDEEFAIELKNVVDYVYKNYPDARNYLTNITLANVDGNSSFIAAFMPIFTFATSDTGSGYPVGSKTQIILNAKYFLNTAKIENSASYGSKTGYFPPNATRSSTVAHEFGHYLSYVALLNYHDSGRLNYVTTGQAQKLYKVYDDFNVGNFSRMLLEEAYQEYVKVYGRDMTFTEFRESISRYAVAKDNTGAYIYDETIAEAFHDCYLNGSNAKPASRMIMKVLNTKL